MPIEHLKELQEIFGGGPVAAFLGLLIITLLAMFGVYMRANRALLSEKDSHAETIRTTSALAVAMERTWNEQLEVTKAQTEQRARDAELQGRSLAVLERSVMLQEQRRKPG